MFCGTPQIAAMNMFGHKWVDLYTHNRTGLLDINEE